MDRARFTYAGAAAMTELHARELRSFARVWRALQDRGTPLPPSHDASYASYDALLRHVLDSAAGYMRWVCRSLAKEPPGIPPIPAQLGPAEVDAHLDRLLETWHLPLLDVEEERFFHPNHPSSGEDLCLELMLEHAIVHPMRHRLQLEGLVGLVGERPR